jgi:hypothetical protein
MFKKYLHEQKGMESNSATVASSAVTGLGASFLTHPFQNLRVQLQSDRDARYAGLVAKTWRQRGIRGFYAGNTASSGMIMITIACETVVKEKLEQMFS